MRGKKTETETIVDPGSGDVLVDLGFPDADERKLRVQLAMRLNELLAGRRLTQARTAQLFGIPQPHVSELKHYKLSRFSSERLLHFLTLLDRDVEIIIRPKAKGQCGGRCVGVGCLRITCAGSSACAEPIVER
jgi:predicted XRE-type DNA-binding protein